ncbi:MAG: hypothetical protein E7Z96_04940 [Actinomycetaceae bacterium]|jgi:hypothetical protein|nr:hypothetical protein [Actinomycetaceae bacterium]
MTMRYRRALPCVVAALFALGACTSADPGADASGSNTTMADSDHDHDHDHDSDANVTEIGGARPRIALSYEGGLMVVDTSDSSVVADLPIDGYSRLNAAGDGRNVLVSTTGGWAVLDTGTFTVPHGDHTHSFVTDPVLTDVLIEGNKPGHVVYHAGRTSTWADDDGKGTFFDTESLTGAGEADELAGLWEYEAAAPHHGVAVPLGDKTALVSVGTEEGRTGAQYVVDGKVSAESSECPGLHGAEGLDDGAVAGCENGALILRDGTFSKATAPDEYGRIGNLRTAEGSPIAVGDYKTDPEGGIGLKQISLINTTDATLRTVDTGSTYTWRGLARGFDGSALVLGTDGALRVINPETGEITRTIPVIDEWQVPEDWQAAHPAIAEHEGFVYVTDPATNTLHTVDYTKGEVVSSTKLPKTPIEIAVATGDAPEEAE